MIDSIKKDVCTGCKMCGDICPTVAIKFKEDYDGCWFPSVDDQKCIKCGLCVSVVLLFIRFSHIILKILAFMQRGQKMIKFGSTALLEEFTMN